MTEFALASILDAIGNTPLVRLNVLAQDCAAQVWVKLENRNPGGSVKDRIALHMLRKALDRGELALGGIFVEPTSGNTGIGLAMAAAVLGMQCVLTMPESMSIERRALLRGMGAELVLTPAAEGMAGAVAAAQKIAAQRGAYLPNQFSNADVVEAHYLTTGPEIWRDTGGIITAFVAGVGTGGTITGVGKYLKERARTRLVAVEPAASPLLSGGQAGAHSIQGIGPNFIPAILDRRQLDAVIPVTDAHALQSARDLLRCEGINCGISSGANVWAALQVARQPEIAGGRVVTVICDTGERYLSTPLFAEGM